eukprot:s1218_g3.t1
MALPLQRLPEGRSGFDQITTKSAWRLVSKDCGYRWWALPRKPWTLCTTLIQSTKSGLLCHLPRPQRPHLLLKPLILLFFVLALTTCLPLQHASQLSVSSVPQKECEEPGTLDFLLRPNWNRGHSLRILSSPSICPTTTTWS